MNTEDQKTNDNYKNKYMKYKSKYIDLKVRLKLNYF